jgi:hypothetical protein
VIVEGWGWAEPACALPVTVAGDLLLVRRAGVAVSLGPLCAYPAGFVFYLMIGIDRGRVTNRTVTFWGRSPADQAVATRLRVEFSDGRVADSLVKSRERPKPGDLVLRFSGGTSQIHGYDLVPRSESRWWVSPLPPPGPVEFTVFLQGAAEPSGTARVDAGLITEAAGRSQVLWPGTETGFW